VEIKADEIVTVQFFNEKEPEPPTPTPPTPPTPPTTPPTPGRPTEPIKPVPQTSDDNIIIFYIVLLGIAAIGSAVSVVVYIKKRKGKHRAAVSIALLLCIALLAGSGCMVAKEAGQYAQSADAYDKLVAFVGETATQPEGSEEPQESEAAPDVGAATSRLPSVDFDALAEVNPDIRAWLLCEDTAINYPIVQGEDNDYYLRRLYDGTSNKSGCLFADYENAGDFSNRNTIIYGHNMLDGAMFSSLTQYQDGAYYEAHPEMLLATPDGNYVIELFAAFVASPAESGTDTSPWELAWESDTDYTAWQAAMQGRSLFQSDVTLSKTDRVLTLSTCINSGRDRFIVMGKLVSVEQG
jgi:SrtB family sortase